MPKSGSNSLKRAVRERMARTGETYTQARSAILLQERAAREQRERM
jgi:hypothetical protein